MCRKENILEAWIMVEHLSEGNINSKEKTIKSFNELQNGNYYQLFYNEIQKSRVESYWNSGIVVYLGVFSFREVIALLREKYHLSPSYEEMQIGDKFSFALYFDKKLKLNGEMTFFTESYYIRRNSRIPKEMEFSNFENEHKKVIEEMFECQENDEYGKYFNQAFSKLLKKYDICVKQCCMKVLTNLETDATNLHSFFVNDLEKAKKISTDNLDAYLLGKIQKRMDLDCRADSDKYNPEIFQRILQPCNYPVSRFPSNPEYALSLMQQIAVNLAIGYDTEKMRSVNGPPGTGKTTLLKDIFAELIVEQAIKIACMNDKMVKGSEKTKYYNNASIGQIPNEISEKGIVVASSNNGAVQNIVNELPLLSGIDESFAESIIEADYFKEIANSKVSAKWEKDENGNKYENLSSKPNDDGEQYWGLFSLEGGKKDNMNYIITVLKHIVKYLENEYVPDTEIYDSFIEQYEKLCNYREERQKVSELCDKIYKLSEQLSRKKKAYPEETAVRESTAKEQIDEIFANIAQMKAEREELNEKYQDYIQHLKNIADEKELLTQELQALNMQKPGFLAGRQKKADFNQKNRSYLENLRSLGYEESTNRAQIANLVNKIKEYDKAISVDLQKPEAIRMHLEKYRQSSCEELQELEKQINSYQRQFSNMKIKPLDMSLDYDSFQKSNPWFGEEYRLLQSQLFIAALKVRKQFLYDNRKNVKAAYIVWGKQKDYLGKKEIISAAWDWINMVVPVISSTFASFSRMCANLERNTLGHLFVDEAGQALPQASVGAIFRSRYVMVVGDPAQIKPVLTLDSSILRMLGDYFEVSEKYLSDSSSVQTIVDSVSKYGFYKDSEKDWIGIPLWVHRRCKFPMFSIANKISYGGNMVQGIEADGKAEWYDICGNATDKYVKEQGIFLREKISELIANCPDIIDKSKKDMIYVISPFKNVAFQLSQELKKIGFTRYDKNGKPTNVGTVHTFQGKEAPIVFLVLGADHKSVGAANWALGTENPNIMNVAATRAKEEFYIIGDKKLYLNLKSDVVNGTYQIIRKFNAEN